MTRYEHGFITKCAEYGVDGRALLEKRAFGVGKPLKKMVDLFSGRTDQRILRLKATMLRRLNKAWKAGDHLTPEITDLKLRLSGQHGSRFIRDMLSDPKAVDAEMALRAMRGEKPSRAGVLLDFQKQRMKLPQLLPDDVVSNMENRLSSLEGAREAAQDAALNAVRGSGSFKRVSRLIDKRNSNMTPVERMLYPIFGNPIERVR